MARFISLNQNKNANDTAYVKTNTNTKPRRKKVYADTSTGGWY